MNLNPTWHFEKMSRSGSITGAAVVESIIAADLSVEELFAREALQNSCDATVPGKPTKLIIREIPEELDRLESIEFETKLKPHIQNSFFRHDDMNKNYTKHVIIEDYNTCGLGGSLQEVDENAHFMRLVYHNATGLTKTVKGQSVGGSFGRGKAAYPSSSHICTVFYYTVYKDGDVSNNRLIGVSYSPEYINSTNDRMTGRAFWGLKQDESNDFFVEPLTGDHAHEYAEKLGFSRRGINDFGTSILIMKCHVDLNNLCKAIEKWWWPRIADNLLDLEIKSLSGDIYYPRPKDNVMIRYFMDAYDEIANKQRSNNTSHAVIKESGVEFGDLAYKILESKPSADSDSEDDDYLNSVALVRGPRMVVQYLSPRLMSNKQFGCGVFLSTRDDSIDSFFKRSEPPAHDRWAEKSERLNEQEKKKLKLVLTHIKKKFREFVNSYEQKNENSGSRAKELERQLGAIFGGGKGIIPPLTQSNDKAICSITNQTRRVEIRNGVFASHVFEFNIALRKEHKVDKALINLVFNTQLSARGAGSSSQLKVEYETITVDGNLIDAKQNTVEMYITKKPVGCVIITQPIDNTFQTEWSMLVKIVNPTNEDSNE